MSRGQGTDGGAQAGGASLTLYVLLAIAALAAGIGAAFLIRGKAPQEMAASAPAAESGSAQPATGTLAVHAAPEPIADIAFDDSDGKARHLSEWRGRVVLLNLWATWCAPCKQEMPALDRLQAKLGGDKFTVLAVSTDRSGQKQPAAFYASANIGHLALYNDSTSEANIKIKAEGLPVSVVLDKQGNEVARILGAAKWDGDDMIAQLSGFIKRYAD